MEIIKAAIFMAGFKEGCLLLPQLGAKAEVAFGPAGLGDLYVTATSPYGRNRSMGEKLGPVYQWMRLWLK